MQVPFAVEDLKFNELLLKHLFASSKLLDTLKGDDLEIQWRSENTSF